MEVSNNKEYENDEPKNLNSLRDVKDVNIIDNEDEDYEGKSLLPKEGQLGQLLDMGDKPRRKLQWNDINIIDNEDEDDDNDDYEGKSLLPKEGQLGQLLDMGDKPRSKMQWNDINIIDNEEEDDDYEGKSLLPKEGQLGQLLGMGDKPRRKVQWNDRNGDKLAEVLVFEPSEVSDSDEEESEACLCRIM